MSTHHHDNGKCNCRHEHQQGHQHDACSCHHDHHGHEPGSCDCHHHHHAESGACPHCEAKLNGEARLPVHVPVRVGVAALALLLLHAVPMPAALPWLRFLLYFAAYLLVGADVLLEAVRNIAHGRMFDEQLLMALATLGAFAIGEYPEGVAVMLFYQLGEFLQTLAVGRSRRSIAALMDIRPESATVLRDGAEHTLSPEQVKVGEHILVRPGERVPLDGVVLVGDSQLDTSALTGESLPRACTVGDRAISGSVNLTGVLTVRVESQYRESTVSKILALVEDAGERKTRVEGFITRFSRYYTPIVFFAALLLALLPPLLFSAPAKEWVYRALVFLVVSCPCALVISVPLSFFAGIGGASRLGILIKGSGYMEQLARVDTVCFDKTGTLTEGRFRVAFVSCATLTEAELIGIAAALEQYSTHPIAAGILAAHAAPPAPVQELHEVAGKGICGLLDGKRYLVGNAAWMQENGIAVPESEACGSVVYVAGEAVYLGHILLRDTPKENARAALEALVRCGVKRTVMLTGDSASVATQIADLLAVTEVHAELLPQQKVEYLEAQLAAGHRVAFVGDGINDAPVLARADVGVAMGGVGSDAAIESADVVLMQDDLGKLATAIRISRRTLRILRQNVAFALAAKGVILLLGALGIANMWLAVFGDVGVMLIAILNAMRAMRTR